MKNSKAVTLLASFQKEELQAFQKFVSSPYFNSNEDLIALFEYFLEQHPEFPSEKLEKKAVYKHLYPNQPYRDKKLSYLMSDLLRLAEQFLGTRQIEQQEVFFNCQALKELMERKQEKHYGYLYRKMEEKLASQQEKDGAYFYSQYLLSSLAADYFASKQVREFDESLQKVSNALDDFYFVQKIKYSCEMLNRQAILSERFSLPFAEEVIRYLEKKEQLPSLTAIYLQIYFSLLEPGEEHHLEKLLKLIKEEFVYVSETELRDVYLFAINMCMRKIREGKNKYLSITLELYVEGIRKKILFDQDFLSHWTYGNAVKLALRLERFEWAEEFIHIYNKYLQAQFQDDALHSNLAELHFHRKDYGQALIHLNQVNPNDINYHLGSRLLLIKSFYESGSSDSLYSSLAAFTVYLSRNKQIAPQLKKSCQNFCSLLNKALRDAGKKNTDKLRQQIESVQPLADRDWLLKVLEKEKG